MASAATPGSRSRSIGDRSGELVLGGGLLVMLALAPSYMSAELLSLVTTALVLAIVSYGVDLVHGTTKYLSLAHVGMWAVAAYTFIGTQLYWDWSIGMAGLASVAAAVLLGVVAGAFVFRTAGFYFAILTLALSEAVRISISNLPSITGGQAGTFLPEASAMGISLTDPEAVYYLAFALCAATVLGVYLVVRSRLGLKCRAIGQSEPLAESLGIDVYRTKLAIFVLSAIPVGLAGIVFPIHVIAITPSDFDVNKALATVLVVILGGSGHRYGPLVGALFYVVVPNYLPISPSLTEAGMGLLLIAVVAVGRRGLAPTIEDGIRALFTLPGRYARRFREPRPGIAADEPKGSLDDG